MNYVLYIVVAVLLIGMFTISRRNRRRQMEAEAERVDRIAVGTEVMTTSGLYGTVAAKNDDGSVMLSVAPGVEVKWAAAALRDAASLNPQYRSAFDRPAGMQADDPDQAESSDGGVDLRKDVDDSD